MKRTDLPDNAEALKTLLLEQADAFQKLRDEFDAKQTECARFAEEVRWLKALLFARRSEQKLAVQSGEVWLSLFNEAEVTQDESPQNEVSPEEQPAAEGTANAVKQTRSRRGRRPLPEDIPREERIIDLPENEKICACGTPLVRVGEVVTEKLTIIPEQIKVIRTTRFKYRCPSCEPAEGEGPAVKTPAMPPQIIPQGLATPGLLAYIIIGKFCDGLPLYRQNKMFERLGIDIPRATMSRWILEAAAACKPVRGLLLADIRAGTLVNMDETPVQVLREPERNNTDKSYMWVICGGNGGAVRLFHYASGRSGEVARTLLGSFAGFLQTDGYAGYTAMGQKKGITHVGCLVHVRRKFADVIKSGGKHKDGVATAVLNEIAKIYHIEDVLRKKKLSDATFLTEREKAVTPRLQVIHERIADAIGNTPPSSLLGRALSYAHGQWPHVIRYLQDARLTPDNNKAENAIRPFVIGRKNWLFAGSPAGADASALFYSLIETAKACNVNPYKYLLHLFEKLPSTPEEQLAALLPWNCQQSERQ